MRHYQENSLKSCSTPSFVEKNDTFNINNNNNNENDNSINTSQVKLRKRSKRGLSPLSDRHSWSEYNLRDDNYNHFRYTPSGGGEKKLHRKSGSFSFSSSLAKRSWTGSDTKLSDIKETDHNADLSSKGRLYNRRHATSVLQLSSISPEKKPSSDRGWMGGIRRKISVTVSLYTHLKTCSQTSLRDFFFHLE